MRRLIPLMLAALVVALTPSIAAGRVLRVGKYHGVRGQFKTIKAAVKAARAGDWILIGPGDYKTHRAASPRPAIQQTCSPPRI